MYPIVYLWLLFSLAALSGSVQAEPGCDDCALSQAPRVWIPGGDPLTDALPLKSSHAEVRINGPIAQVVVTQHYQNAAKRAINARYVFPGSTRAAVHGLTMKVGERIVKAQLKEISEAQQVFDQAKTEGKRAALLTQHRPNVFMMDMANLMPGDDIELELTYSELLVPELGIYQFVYPTVVGPRYGTDPLQNTTDAAWQQNPYIADSAAGDNPAAIDTAIHVALDSPLAIKELNSTQHKIETQWRDAKSADIQLAAGEQHAGNRDFILQFRLQDNAIMSGLMTYEHDDEQYFLAMVEPPARVNAEHIMPREYLFVVDVSGSMNGFPLDTSRQLMQQLLSSLKPHETFNILFFAGSSQSLSPEPLPVNTDSIQKAMTMMNNYQGNGGTELMPALNAAYAMRRATDAARSIVVVTDGFISAEREVYDLIAQNLNTTSVFAFGIGSSVNRSLIESMAQVGAGEPFIVTDPSQVAEVSARFRRYVAAPLLSQIELKGKEVELYDMEPAKIPVMLAERPIVVFGKYRNDNDAARLVLSGRSATEKYRVELPFSEARHENRAELLPVLWARQRVQRLSDWVGNQVELHRQAIVELGLKFSLLTRYTAFVAVDQVLANPAHDAKDVQQPLPVPQGMVGMATQSMPEPDLMWLLSLMGLGVAGQRWLRRHV